MNLPNKLTLSRILLVPVFMVFAARGGFSTDRFLQSMYLVAGIIFAVASITDLLDGKIARKKNLITDFGKFADPLADKMLTTAALLYMVKDGVCSPAVVALVLFREFAVAGVRMIAAASGTVIAANLLGKIKTNCQMFTILFYYFAVALLGHLELAFLPTVTQILCWLVAALTLASGAIYLWQNRSCFMQAK